jgi:hypothetical protein
MKLCTVIKAGLAVIVASTFLTFGLATPAVTGNQRPVNLNDIAIATPETVINAPSSLIVSKKSNTSMKIKWSRVGNAKGYKIYRYNSKSKKVNKFKRVKTIKNKNVKSWTNRKLKYGKTYTYKIKSYTVEGSKTVYSNYSYYAKAKLYKVGAKKINATKLSTF